MNCTQNKKIEQVKETTMIVGIDVSSEKHRIKGRPYRSQNGDTGSDRGL